MIHSQSVSAHVARLYNTYPFPPEPILDEPPPGYNWRWNWITAAAFCSGRKPTRLDVRILDAGCGTGVSTEYLAHLNPHAHITGIDISEGALDIARERCQRSGAGRVEFRHLSLYDVEQLSGEFDYINCVGVLHHLREPQRGLQSLAAKLAPAGYIHIFVYAALGRWEIQLMQEALALLQGDSMGDFRGGVQLGRTLFAALPEGNRLRRREEERWAMENQRDECFADMYLHPQETDYTIDTLFELIDKSGLDFLGFSNPGFWQLERLFSKQTDLIKRAALLTERQRYRLTELLDPDVSHYEFFLAKPPVTRINWSHNTDLWNATAELSPCTQGWPHQLLFNGDYQVVHLTEGEYLFLEQCTSRPDATVGDILETISFDLDGVRSLLHRQLILLTPHG